MTFALVGLVAAVLAFHVYQAQQWAKERALLVKAVMARSPEQFLAATQEHKPRPKRDDDEIVMQVGV